MTHAVNRPESQVYTEHNESLGEASNLLGSCPPVTTSINIVGDSGSRLVHTSTQLEHGNMTLILELLSHCCIETTVHQAALRSSFNCQEGPNNRSLSPEVPKPLYHMWMNEPSRRVMQNKGTLRSMNVER
jgi:hypothetical protein